MALRDIVKEPDERLRKVCRPVKEITPHILTLLDDMAETMAFAEGVGLAAPQVGVLRRIVVVDVGEGLIELINPEIGRTDRTGGLSVLRRSPRDRDAAELRAHPGAGSDGHAARIYGRRATGARVLSRAGPLGRRPLFGQDEPGNGRGRGIPGR